MSTLMHLRQANTQRVMGIARLKGLAVRHPGPAREIGKAIEEIEEGFNKLLRVCDELDQSKQIAHRAVERMASDNADLQHGGSRG